jgi:hypothetical protein
MQGVKIDVATDFNDLLVSLRNESILGADAYGAQSSPTSWPTRWPLEIAVTIAVNA